MSMYWFHTMIAMLEVWIPKPMPHATGSLGDFFTWMLELIFFLYSLVICYIAIEAMAIEIVSLPIEDGDFP